MAPPRAALALLSAAAAALLAPRAASFTPGNLLLSLVGDGTASRNYFAAAFPGNITDTEAWAKIVDEAPGCFKNRGTGGGETPCIRPRAGGEIADIAAGHHEFCAHLQHL